MNGENYEQIEFQIPLGFEWKEIGIIFTRAFCVTSVVCDVSIIVLLLSFLVNK